MKIIVLKWRDVAKTMNDDDFDDDKNINSRLIEMTTVGYLYKESNDVILLVQEFIYGLPRDYVTIPKSLVISISVISESEET
jgi:hypothetical protein